MEGDKLSSLFDIDTNTTRNDNLTPMKIFVYKIEEDNIVYYIHILRETNKLYLYYAQSLLQL